jgi:hypothetical protein
VYKYYSTQRPVGLGTFPGKPVEIHNFNKRIDTGLLHVGPAWGWLLYDKELTYKEADDYELVSEEIVGL